MDDHPFHAKTKVDPTPSETLRRFYHSNCYFWFTMFQLILTLSLISIVLVDLKTHQKHRPAIITIGTQTFYSLPQSLNFFTESVVLCFFLSDVLIRILVFKCFVFKNAWFMTDLAVFLFLVLSAFVVYTQGYFNISETFDLILLFVRVGLIVTKSIITIVRMIQNVALTKANLIQLDKTISSIHDDHQSEISETFGVDLRPKAVSRKVAEKSLTTLDVNFSGDSFVDEASVKNEITTSKALREVEMGRLSDQSILSLQRGMVI
jgi:hypothetical protein